MSEQAIKEFTSKLASDEGLQKELRDAAGVGSDDALTTGALIDFAASKGYEFTVDEVRAEIREMFDTYFIMTIANTNASTVDEVRAAELSLSDAELEGVVGGAAFVKYDGIDGEATDKDHKGWSDLLSFSQVITYGGFTR